MYLESWIHHILNSTLKNDAGYRLFANSDNLVSVTRSDVETYQIYKLRRMLRHCGEKSAFYREVFRAMSIEPDDIHNSADIARIPLTEPDQLAESPYRFLCISQAEIARPYTFITSGTTGPKKRIFWTHHDIERITDFMGAGIGSVADQSDTVLILLPDGRPNSQADLLYKGVRKLGATPVVADSDLDAGEFLRIVKESHCTVIFGYTRKLWRLSKEIQMLCNPGSLGVKVLFLASEYLADAMRRDLQKIWNCSTRTHYGLTEMGLGVAVECEACDGYHFNEIDLLLEVINPVTGKAVAPGEEGELVFTTITREGMPLIRYRTHDISRLITEPCPCGATSLLKIGQVKKRLENTVIVGEADEMYPALFDDVLFEIPGLVDYQVIVTREEGKDRLDFRIEMMSDSGNISEIAKMLSSSPIIAKNIAAGKMSPPELELTKPGELRSVSRAKKMILDLR